jgi:asparagine synthase (glutamine-hydrolysing)
LKTALWALRAWPVSDDKISFEYKLKRFLEGSLMRPDQAHIYWNGAFSETQANGLTQAQLPASLNRVLGDLREKLPGDGLRPYMWFDQKYYLTDDILMKVDRMSMAHAVEARPPLLDHRIVEFAASLPASFKLNGSRQKVLLKELMKDKLPASVLKRGKAGLDIPSHEWLRGPLRPLMLDSLQTGMAEHGGLFRKSAIDRCVRDHLERRANLGYHLWGLMILFMWMKKWGIQTSAVPAAQPPAPESALTSI